MLYYKEYINHKSNIVGKRKKCDNNIYTFDIETSSYLILDDKIMPAIDYLKLSDIDKEKCIYQSNMYIWMFSINEDVYFGRYWHEFVEFLNKINENIPDRKIIFVHNLSFEFQYLSGVFEFSDVMARKKRKVMRCILKDLNFEFRCSYMMSNVALKKLPSMFNLPVEKMVGDLDYSLVRHSETKLTDKELGYCKNDCLVVYNYIKYELQTYGRVDKIPMTSTGHVRKELKELIQNDYKYKKQTKKAININPHIYNMLMKAFMGGYTHANWIYASEVKENVTSWDFTSSYPYVLVSYKYPSSEFKKCNIKSREEMSKRFCYLLTVKFKKIKSNYFNNFIPKSKCENIVNGVYDNGRVIKADELAITLTDVDFYFILDSHICTYEILECYWCSYNYLPKTFINFILDKYVKKTEYKNVLGKEVEYQREKSLFNSLYGMSVTNTIRDEVIYNNNEWCEIELTNDEIMNALLEEKNKAFMNFATGVWVTAYARDNLLRNVLKLDDYVVYCDTDSCKVLKGYNENVINDYNNKVKKRLEYVSKLLNIPLSRFSPKDIYGENHMLGVFDKDAEYLKFITQGAKKYAYEYIKPLKKCKKTDYIIKDDGTDAHVINITVSGVPKSGAFALKKIEDFKDDLLFPFELTNKNMLIYADNQIECKLTDYQGNKLVVNDKKGCCVVPTTYILGKSEEYAELLNDESSKRAVYKE